MNICLTCMYVHVFIFIDIYMCLSKYMAYNIYVGIQMC